MSSLKKLPVFFLGLLFVIIVGLLGFNLFFFSPGKSISLPFLNGKKISLSSLVDLIPGQSKDDGSLALPVEKKYLDKAEVVQLDLGKNSLGFQLPPETVFYAAFDGSVEITGKFPQQVINLSSSDGSSKLLYVFAGEAQVENMSQVKKGDTLGKAGGENLPTREVNLIVQYFAYGNQISISKDLVKDFMK